MEHEYRLEKTRASGTNRSGASSRAGQRSKPSALSAFGFRRASGRSGTRWRSKQSTESSTGAAPVRQGTAPDVLAPTIVEKPPGECLPRGARLFKIEDPATRVLAALCDELGPDATISDAMSFTTRKCADALLAASPPL